MPISLEGPLNLISVQVSVPDDQELKSTFQNMSLLNNIQYQRCTKI